MTIDVKAANAEGQYETVYSAQAGNKSKNILLKRNLVQYKAHTLAHNPEPPHEKRQPKPIDYIIQSGDTLSEISARYEVSISELAGNNGIKDPNKIYPGQKIVIYGKKDPDDVDSGKQSPWEGNGESYPVPPNDPTASAGDGSYPVDGSVSAGGWVPDTTDGSDSFPAGTGGTTPSAGTGESYPVPPNDPSADAGNGSHPVDGPLSPGGWIPDTTDGSDSSPAGTGGTTPSAGTGGTVPSPTSPPSTDSEPINPQYPAEDNDENSPGGKKQTNNNGEKISTVGGKNSGNPQAHVRLSQDEAPWMVTAIAEAEKYKGADESIIEKSENFHSLSNVNWIPTMVGKKNAWCASFINYCLQVNNYAMWREAQRSQDIAKKNNKERFKEIKEPVYGCMVMLSGHITLMYGIDKNNNKKFIGLGGNQGGVEGVFGGTIRFSSFLRSRARFFLPVGYDSKSDSILGNYDASELNKHFKIQVIEDGNGIT